MELPPELSFTARNGIQVRIDDKVIEPYRAVKLTHHAASTRHLAAAADAPITELVFSWCVRFTSLHASQWVLCGIIANPNPDDNSYSDPTCYGFATAGDSSRGGKWMGESPWRVIRAGDQAVLTFDRAAGKLSCLLSRNGAAVWEAAIDGVPQRDDWRLHFNMHNRTNQVIVWPSTPAAVLKLRTVIQYLSMRLRPVGRAENSKRLGDALAAADALPADARDPHAAVFKEAHALVERLGHENKHVAALEAAIKQRDYAKLRDALDNALALQPPLTGQTADRAQQMLADIPRRVAAWLQLRLRNGATWDADGDADVARRHSQLNVLVAEDDCLYDHELYALMAVIEGDHGAVRCACQRQQHEAARAVIRELTQAVAVMAEAEEASVKEVADRAQREYELREHAKCLTAALYTSFAERDRAEAELRAAEEALRRAQGEAKRTQHACTAAQQDYDAADRELTAAEAKAASSTVHEAHVSDLHAFIVNARDTRDAELRRAHDRLGAPQALGTLEQGELDLLLVELGLCCYIEPFAQHELGPKALQHAHEAQIRLAVQGAERARFGDVRALRLALESIDQGNGLPPVAEAKAPEGSPSLWSAEAVRAWVAGQGLNAASRACAEARVNGPCLLSMQPADIFDRTFSASLGMDERRRFQQAVDGLRQREGVQPATASAAAAAPVEVLSAAVAHALGGGEPCAFPLGYLRRCTAGFGETRLVGEGTFGTVYRAVDPVTGVRFAVKRLRGAVATRDATARAVAERTMRRELEVLTAIQHPNIIKLLGHCGIDGELCLVYEFGVYGSLADNLIDDAKAAALGWKVRVRILTGLASALNFLHRHADPPIYHRDVKSANVVLCEGFEPKLIDCGLAKLLTGTQATQHQQGQSMFTMAGTGNGLLGTQGYMCPTYVTTNKFGDKSEVFSFGIVLLEVLTGKLNALVDGGLYGHFFADDDEDGEDLTAAAIDVRPDAMPFTAAPLIDLATQCVGPIRQRPRMQGVLAPLRRLTQQHAQLTVEEVQSRLAAVTNQAAALTSARREEQQAAAVEARRAEAERRAAEAAALRTCCICYDDLTVADGIECAAEQAHFVCDVCFSHHALTESEKPVAELRDRNAEIYCPMRRRVQREWLCASEQPYDKKLVLAHAAPAAFEAVLHARAQVQEAQLVEELEQDFAKRLEVERRRIEQLAVEELRVRETVRHIQERILTLKCPRAGCEAAFVDFNGCFALTCHRCHCGFCAYCLQDCGRDAHPHVPQCPHNIAPGRDVYGNPELFERAQRQRRQRMVAEYLATVDEAIRPNVVAACVHDFADLGIEVRV